MTKRIDVPGVGIVEFPDSMSDEQVTNAIRTNIMPKYSAQMETPTQTFGRSAASLADTALNTLTGTMDIGARALARAYYGGLRGKSTEEAERLAQQEGTSPKDIVGRAFGVTGTPGYEQAPLRQLGTYAGETIGQNVIQPLAEATGLPEGYVGDVVNLGTAAIAPAIPKVAKVAATPITETAAGFRQGLAQPTYQRGAGSSFVPLQEKFYPAKQVEPFMKAKPEQRVGMLPELEASQKPSSSLFTNTPGMLARNLGPKTSAGETLIPFRGETMRAFGEQMARDIGTNTLPTAGVSLGGALLGGLVGGVPGALIGGAVAPVARLGQLGTLGTLGRTARFSRGFPEALGEAQTALTQGGRQTIAGPVAPRLEYTPRKTVPTYSENTQPIYVAPEGVAGQNINQVSQAGVMSRYPQMPTPQQLAQQRSAQTAQTSGNVVQQQAAQQVAGLTPEQQLAQRLAGQPGYQPPQSLFAGQPSQPKPATPAPATPAPATPAPAPVKTTKPKQPTVEPTTTEGKIEAMHIEKPTKGVTFGETFDKALKQHTKEPGSATWYEDRAGLTKGGTIENIVKKKIGFPQNPDFDFTHGVRLKNGEQFVYGIETSSNSPIIATGGGFVYKANPKGKFEYYKQYDKSGEVAETPKPSKKKGPSNISQMMVDDDVAKTFNALKSAGESPLEQKIAGMTQVNRDRLEANIRQAAKPGDPMIQEYLNLFEKYRIK